MKKTIRMFLLLTVAALCFCLTGCVTTGTGHDFDDVAPKSSVSESLGKEITGEE